MTDVINLNRARKEKARQEKELKANANRVLHGLPRQARGLAKARAEKARREWDAHKKD
ncbi:MAG: DUF4169 family protein [Rhizomicrobium sp.]